MQAIVRLLHQRNYKYPNKFSNIISKHRIKKLERDSYVTKHKIFQIY